MSKKEQDVDSTRRTLLATGAMAAAAAAAPRAFSQQGSAQEGTSSAFYERGDVRIHYEDTGSGFPLLIIAGGGLC